MLSLEPVIAARVRDALTPIEPAWTVKGYTTDGGRRDGPQLASVRFLNGNVAASKAGGASVEVGWRVTLSVARGETAAEALDAAVSAVIGTLQNWPPGKVSGRNWERLRLLQVLAPQYAEDALEGVSLTFITSALYEGQR